MLQIHPFACFFDGPIDQVLSPKRTAQTLVFIAFFPHTTISTAKSGFNRQVPQLGHFNRNKKQQLGMFVINNTSSDNAASQQNR
jgi:hypothetical protein